MTRVFVSGLGAVSPAGWGVPALSEALDKGRPLPVQPLERPGWDKPLQARLVPNLAHRPKFLAHPRLRRTSPITQYAASAALEAVASSNVRTTNSHRLGIVFCLQSGCVQFSCRFFEEALENPATASPLLFPETVFAAPASHVAAILAETRLLYTLVGDPACFLQGVAVGVQWLEQEHIETCLIIGAEETNWLLADALWHFEHSAVISGGAGAVCLSLDPAASIGVELSAITDPHTYSTVTNRAKAAQAMREQLPACSPGHLLCDGLHDSPRADAAELAAWSGWYGPRLSPKRILGEGLMAAAAWQCVAACAALSDGRFPAANVSLVGSNQQAIGARFVRAGANTGASPSSNGSPSNNPPT